jgi:hypothetical protein
MLISTKYISRLSERLNNDTAEFDKNTLKQAFSLLEEYSNSTGQAQRFYFDELMKVVKGDSHLRSISWDNGGPGFFESEEKTVEKISAVVLHGMQELGIIGPRDRTFDLVKHENSFFPDDLGQSQNLEGGENHENNTTIAPYFSYHVRYYDTDNQSKLNSISQQAKISEEDLPKRERAIVSLANEALEKDEKLNFTIGDLACFSSIAFLHPTGVRLADFSESNGGRAGMIRPAFYTELSRHKDIPGADSLINNDVNSGRAIIFYPLAKNSPCHVMVNLGDGYLAGSNNGCVFHGKEPVNTKIEGTFQKYHISQITVDDAIKNGNESFVMKETVIE